MFDGLGKGRKNNFGESFVLSNFKKYFLNY